MLLSTAIFPMVNSVPAPAGWRCWGVSVGSMTKREARKVFPRSRVFLRTLPEEGTCTGTVSLVNLSFAVLPIRLLGFFSTPCWEKRYSGNVNPDCVHRSLRSDVESAEVITPPGTIRRLFGRDNRAQVLPLGIKYPYAAGASTVEAPQLVHFHAIG